MSIMHERITPYEGMESISLRMSYEDTKSVLKEKGIVYRVEVWENKGCDPEVPWKIIQVEKGIRFFYAKDKMFKMCFEDGYEGRMANGIYLGIPLENAKKLDETLVYDEENEDYGSTSGYWLETNSDDDTVVSITVFIPALEDEDFFFSYKWAE